jgi:hypothetical protein
MNSNQVLASKRQSVDSSQEIIKTFKEIEESDGNTSYIKKVVQRFDSM